LTNSDRVCKSEKSLDSAGLVVRYAGVRGAPLKTVACFVLVVCCLAVACGAAPEPEEEESTTPEVEDGSSLTTGEEDASNSPPQILSLDAVPVRVNVGAQASVVCSAFDPDGDTLTYEWGATGGAFSTLPDSRMSWRAPDRTGEWVITVTVTDSGGNVAKESVTITVGENRPPVIRNLQADSPSVIAGESTLVTCEAEDPDGDTLTYEWRATGGELTGAGPHVTWFAPTILPGQTTDYTVTAAVDDGKGGFDVEEVTLHVEIPYVTKVFTPSPQESGTVCTDGSVKYEQAKAGDDDDNEGYRAFWTYDLYELRGARVVEATLEFDTGFISASKQALAEDNPFNKPRGMGGLHIYQVRYEPGALPEYDIEPVKELTESALWQPPTEIDVTTLVERIALGAAASDRLQIMAAFLRDSDDNMFGEYISWRRVVLHVSYMRE